MAKLKILEGLSFKEYCELAEVVWIQEDRIAQLLNSIDQKVPIAPFVQPVIAMDVNGKAKPLINAAGVFPVTEASAATINTHVAETKYAIYASRPAVFNTPAYSPSTGPEMALHKLSITQFSLAGGVKNNQDLTGMAAVAGYKLCVKIIGVISGTGIAAATVTFHDDNPTALPGLINGAAVLALAAYTMNTQIKDCVLGLGTANKKGQVDVAGGAGVEVITIMAEYWYEA